MPVEDSVLWSVLRTKVPKHEQQVRQLVDHAAGLLLTVRDTFPTYTLHDERHAANLVRIMGELLQPQIDDLDGLEAAILILAAYFHDIGMVYSTTELAQLTSEEEFDGYLRHHPQEYVQVHANGGTPPLDVLENYCRSRHAERVWEHLNRVDRSLLRWDAVPITTALADVCRSHNLAVEALKGDEFSTTFLGTCDLRMCAIMLRLADILDFDNSRTPASVYTHLNLADRSTPARSISDGEWRKHLVSNGFRFPGDRPPGYRLDFAAGPDQPAVERDIRHFLHIIDDELRRCRSLLDFCANRWRQLPLPSEVDRSNIHSDGYRYGEFSFELDRSAILELFVGRNLYQNPFAFVRELLQNAIDAVRVRTALGLHGDDEPRVDIQCWQDSNCFIWFRIDDTGIGMDDEALHRYFLRVGRSYYESAELRAELRRRGADASRFGAISRFGIGVLSCFLAGDQIELSTRRVRPGAELAKPLRLTMTGVDDFFTVREPPMAAEGLANRFGLDPKPYRAKCGTSILVRIDPNKVDLSPEAIGEEIDRMVLCPPVSVHYNGRQAGTLQLADLLRPSDPEPMVHTFNGHPTGGHGEPGDSLRDDADLWKAFPYHGAVQIVRLPLIIGEPAPAESLNGRLDIIAAVVPTPTSADLLDGWPAAETADLPAELVELLRSCVGGVHATIRQVEVGLATADVHIKLARRVRPEYVPLIRGFLRKHPEWLAGMPQRAGSWRESLRQLLEFIAEESDVSIMGGTLERTITSERVCLITVSSSARFSIQVQTDGLLLPQSHYSTVQWSHNGIAPTSKATGGISFSGSPARERIGLPVARSTPFALHGFVALADHLRPDLPPSREAEPVLPFPVQSALQLTVRRCAARYLAGPHATLAQLIRGTSLNTFSHLPTNAIALDSASSAAAWCAEELFDVDGRLMSIDTLRQRAAGMPGATIRLTSAHDFYRYLEEVLVQNYLDVCWRPGAESGELQLASGRTPDLPAGLLHFPPLYFVAYESDNPALRLAKGPVNRNHPLARWLISQVEVLTEQMPVLLGQLRNELTGFRMVKVSSTYLRAPAHINAVEINRILDRIRRGSDPALWPPDAAYLAEDRMEDGLWSR